MTRLSTLVLWSRVTIFLQVIWRVWIGRVDHEVRLIIRRMEVRPSKLKI